MVEQQLCFSSFAMGTTYIPICTILHKINYDQHLIALNLLYGAIFRSFILLFENIPKVLLITNKRNKPKITKMMVKRFHNRNKVHVLGFKLLPYSSLGIEKEIELCTRHFLLPPRGSKCPRTDVTEAKPIQLHCK